MKKSGTLTGIAVRPGSGIPMQTLDNVEIAESSGLVGDHRRRRGKRQVTVLTREGWEAACRDVNAALPWTTRRANLLVAGLDLAEKVGARLQSGEVVLEITGETDPCDNMEAAHPGLMAALDPGWRGGVTCRVIRGGTVAVGDEVALLVDAPA